VIRVDKGSVHKSWASTEWLEEHGMHRMPQPSYSPDLASNGFYFFPPVKEKLERTQIADEDQFFESLQAILRDIDHEKLNKAFQAWVQRVQEISEDNRDYIG
jgi:hypothetical protein